jgi:hypothetical protein
VVKLESRQHLLNLTTVELVNMIIDLEEKVDRLEEYKGQLEEEKQWLYGKLNKILDVIEKARFERR